MRNIPGWDHFPYDKYYGRASVPGFDKRLQEVSGERYIPESDGLETLVNAWLDALEQIWLQNSYHDNKHGWQGIISGATDAMPILIEWGRLKSDGSPIKE